MYTDDHAPQATRHPSVGHTPDWATFPSVEERYRKAAAGLSAAQQAKEKKEAAIELTTARAALSLWMEEIWPGMEGGREEYRQEECLEECPGTRVEV